MDCILDRFEKFKERGEVCEDGISINRLCSACRDDNWMKGKSISEAISIVESDLKNVYSLLIIDKEEGDVLARLKISLEERQTLNPRQIVFVYSADYPLATVTEFLINYVRGTNIKYNAIRVLEERYEREIIDIGARSVNGMFYTVIENGQILSPNSLELLYNSIEKKLQKIALVTNPTLNGFTVLKKLHQAVNGNDGGFIEDKLLSLSEDESNLDMIKTWQQLSEEDKSNDTFYKDIINE